MKTSNSETAEQILPAEAEVEPPAHQKFLNKWLNKSMKIEITDGRVLIGTFVCTDMQANIILGSCQEYIDSASISKLVY